MPFNFPLQIISCLDDHSSTTRSITCQVLDKLLTLCKDSFESKSKCDVIIACLNNRAFELCKLVPQVELTVCDSLICQKKSRLSSTALNFSVLEKLPVGVEFTYV